MEKYNEIIPVQDAEGTWTCTGRVYTANPDYDTTKPAEANDGPRHFVQEVHVTGADRAEAIANAKAALETLEV